MQVKLFTLKKAFFLFSFIAVSSIAKAQVSSFPQAHSHNDYANTQPFVLAFEEGFGSIEADIHLFDGKLLVGHDQRDLNPEKTFESLYIQPLERVIRFDRTLQLLIDLKTGYKSTLDSLVALLNRHPIITKTRKIKIVVSGNRPPEDLYESYPDFIWFDGRPGIKYSRAALKRVALISEGYSSVIGKEKYWPINASSEERLLSVIKAAHKMGKPVRFWGTPDFPDAWSKFIELGVDFLNTDKINELSDFLIKRNNAWRQLPYSRIIASAGVVVRYGKPELENHTLDVADLNEKDLVAIQERYGFFVMDIKNRAVVDSFRFESNPSFKSYMSTYSGIKVIEWKGKKFIVWGAADRSGSRSAVFMAQWDGKIGSVDAIYLDPLAPARNALPNELVVSKESSGDFLYVVLNGNNELIKISLDSKQVVWRTRTGVAPYGIAKVREKIVVSNWAGSVVTDTAKSTAPVPWHLAYTDPSTGATAEGTISVFESGTGALLREVSVGLHPTHLLSHPTKPILYVVNSSSDMISVVDANNFSILENIHVGLFGDSILGSTPNGISYDVEKDLLYISNGHDNAIAVVKPGLYQEHRIVAASKVMGYIPTEAFPAGIMIKDSKIIVCNLESDGANVIDARKRARSIHNELASISIIERPSAAALSEMTVRVQKLSNSTRFVQSKIAPRKNVKPLPVPERIGEPSVFKHVVYIIKENKTYDQVFGDLKTGNGDSTLCVFGEKITPNIHALVRQFGLMDNYHASGKSSAEGHQWTDAGIVSDYVEKNVRAWFRSYPHRQDDALVYSPSGFIWNHVLKFGKTVRVFGEACETEYDRKLDWFDFFERYRQGVKPNWFNKTTIDNMNTYISKDFPDCDNMVFSDQQRADIFMNEWKELAEKDELPQLMLLSLPNDHTAGTSPEFPTPEAMVADNDLAVGRIIEMISKSKYWDSTVIFITQDDSQGGWDHVSAYRTVGAVVSAYSSPKVNSVYYNQVSILRTIEQILGVPPMNTMDATARLMTECFTNKKRSISFEHLQSNIPLDKRNKPLAELKGKARKYAILSRDEVFNEVDGGSDDTMNRILWQYFKGSETYPMDIKLK